MIKKAKSRSAAKQTKQLADYFKVLGDATRLRILVLLRRHEELDVTTLCGQLKLSQPLVSHHIALLRDVGILEQRKQGKHRFYRLQADHLTEAFEPFLLEFFTDDLVRPESANVNVFDSSTLCVTNA